MNTSHENILISNKEARTLTDVQAFWLVHFVPKMAFNGCSYKLHPFAFSPKCNKRCK